MYRVNWLESASTYIHITASMLFEATAGEGIYTAHTAAHGGVTIIYWQ